MPRCSAKSGSLLDDDIVCGETTLYVDPWSKKNIDIPVRNKACSHIYDKATALKMCSRTKGTISVNKFYCQ